MVKRNDNANTGNDPLDGNEDIVRMLRQAPEREWPDIAPRVMAEIERRRAMSRRRAKIMAFIASAAAAAAAIAIVAMTPDAAEPPRETTPPQIAESNKSARDSAADWLLAAQEKDGTWNPASWGGSKSYGTAVTGFVIMSLAQRDSATLDDSIARAAASLRAAQEAGGNLGGQGDAMMFNHAVATVALLRLYSTGRFPELFTPIDGAVNYIRSTQAPSGTWAKGKPESHLWLVEALSIASDLGWQDTDGQLRRGIMRLESATGTAAKTLAGASSLDEKKAAVERLCSDWLKSGQASAAGGALYTASIASL